MIVRYERDIPILTKYLIKSEALYKECDEELHECRRSFQSCELELKRLERRLTEMNRQANAVRKVCDKKRYLNNKKLEQVFFFLSCGSQYFSPILLVIYFLDLTVKNTAR